MKDRKPGLQNTCSPISSTCVDWEGGNVLGIDVCETDTIEDIICKVNKVVNSLRKELDLTELDLKGLVEVCAQCPEPVKTLHTILTLLINKVVSLESLIGQSGSGTSIDTNVILASCFRFTNLDGDTITELPVSEYTKKIGLEVCRMLLNIASQQNTIDDHETRITTLESANTGPTVPSVNSVCVAPGASLANPIVKPVTDAFELLEKNYCNISSLLGKNTDLSRGIGTDVAPDTSGAIYKLTDNNVTLFTDAATTVGDLLQHFGLAINDLRSAVKLIQLNCCKITCDDIVVDFDVRLSDDRLTATLFFITKSHVPVGFTDCNANLGNRLTVTDASGNQHQINLKVADEVNNPGGFVVDLTASPIDPTKDYFFSMDACLTDGTTNCVKCVNKAATYKDTCAYCTYTVTGSNNIQSFVRISYTENNVLKTVKILAGENKILPKNIKLNSLAYSGSATISSTCENLSNVPVETIDCFGIYFGANPTDSSPILTYETIYLKGISVNGTKYPFANTIEVNGGTASGISALAAAANTNLQINQLLDTVSAGFWVYSDRANYSLWFAVPPSIGNTVFLYGVAESGSDGVKADFPIQFPALPKSELNTTDVDPGLLAGCAVVSD